MRICTLLLAFWSTLGLHAQYGNPHIFDVGAQHRPSGWYIGAGANQLFAQDDFEQTIRLFPSDSLPSYNGNFSANGRLGFVIEGGHFWLPAHGFVELIELGLAYRQYRGGESYTATRLPSVSDTLPLNLAGEGTFSEDLVALNVRLAKSIPLRDYWYLLPALGADVSYRVINDFSYEPALAGLRNTTIEQNLNVHVNASMGIGYKTSASSWLDLRVETPIQNLLPFDGLQSRRNALNSLYRPTFITLRYMWLKGRPDRSCPTPPSPKKSKRSKKSKGGMKNGQLG